VVAEHTNVKLSGSTLNAITAAQKFGKPVTVLIAGDKCDTIAKQIAGVAGVGKVVVADNPVFAHAVAEDISDLIQQYHKEKGFSVLLAPASANGKNILPRVGAIFDVQPLTDVTGIENGDTFTRPIYAGNVMAKFQSSDPIKILTIRATSFEPAAIATNSSNMAPIESYSPPSSSSSSSSRCSWVRDELSVSVRPELTSARVVVSGGRALKSGENFKILEELADLLGGAVGASRAAVDAGYVPNDYQVGQTGKVVAPDLYIAVGISGAIQHLAGMKDSKTIVAINKDPEAPIFQVADYGLVADLFKAIPELTAEIKKAKGN